MRCCIRSSSARSATDGLFPCSYEHLLHEGRPDRGAIISTVLLPFLRSEEQQGRTNLSKRLAKRQRDVLFSW